MSEYWQEKRITNRHVAYAWAMAFLVLAGMQLYGALVADRCPADTGGRDRAASPCAEFEYRGR